MTNRREFLKGCTITLSSLFLSVFGLAKDTRAESVEKQPESMAERIAAGDTVVLVNGSEIQCIDVKISPPRFSSIYKCRLSLQFSRAEWSKISRRSDLHYVLIEIYRNGTRQTLYSSGCWRSSREYTLQWNIVRTYTTHIWKI